MVDTSGLKVLLCVEHTSGAFGGEAAIPLQLFRVLRARGVETWLITHARTRTELERLFPDAGEKIHLIPDTRMHRFLIWFDRFNLGRLNYYTNGLLLGLLTQWMARKVARRLIKQHGIDVVHQPIPVSPKEFSLIRKMGVPVVMGPLNGGMTFPPAFRDREAGWTTSVVKMGRMFSNLANRIVRGKLEADVLLVANERSRRALPAGVRGKVIELVENGVDVSLWKARDEPSAKRPSHASPVQFIFTGRLIPLKGMDLMLRALAMAAKEADVEMTVVGEGPERAGLEALTKELGLEKRVTFKGWMSQKECAAELLSADALVLPSLHECGGAVILEAMCVGLPVLATKWGGPADYVDDSCGILVEPAGKDAFVEGLREGILRLAKDPELRERMGRAGREKVLRDFDWERKGDRMMEIYAQAVGAGVGSRGFGVGPKSRAKTSIAAALAGQEAGR